MSLRASILVFIWCATNQSALVAAESTVTVVPTDPPSLAVNIQAAAVTLPSGATVQVKAGHLPFDGPELRTFEVARDKQGKLPPLPDNYAPYFDAWEPWPGAPHPVGLSPKYDDQGVLILGGLYRAFREDTVEVTSEDGTQHYKDGVDFVFNPDWGQIANKDGKMKETITAKAKAGQSRIDLIQVGPDGVASIKKGATALSCPMIPSPDPGYSALAGIYIAPWTVARSPFYIGKTLPKTASEYAVTEHDIFPIHADKPSQPIHPENIAKSLDKLRQGQPLTIAFMGDSITLGAEATNWYGPDPYGPSGKTYRGKFVYGLKTRFPGSEIKTVDAFKGATGIDYGLEQYTSTVAPAKPDLVVIGFGSNDAAGPVGGPPKIPIDKFTASLAQLVAQIKKDGADVILILPEPMLPWLKNGATQRLPAYREAMLDVAEKYGTAVADMNAESQNLANRGIPPWSQLHNWVNHPGDYVHGLFADVLLRFFPIAGATSTTSSTGTAITQGAPSLTDGFLDQPKAAVGHWKVAPQALPPLEQIIQTPVDDRPVYGVYCWPDEYIRYHDMIQKVGWTSVRLGGPMSDDAMKLCAEDNIEVMACLAGSAQPALQGVTAGNRSKYDSDDAFIDAYQKLAAAYLERWGPRGTFFKEHPDVPNHPVLHVEIFNEPNFFYLDQPHWMPAKDEADRIATETRREKLYSRLLPAVYQTIKGKWPEVQVVGFGAGGASAGDMRFIQHVHEDNPSVAHSYDILSTHPYNGGAPPEETRIEKWGEYSMANSLAVIRKTMSQFGASDKPIWYSELNWEISAEEDGRYSSDAEHPVEIRSLTQTMQAAYLVRGYAWTVRLGVRRLDYMSLIDTDHCDSGMMNPDGTWRLSAKAIQTMIHVMPHPVLVGAISDGLDGNYIYRFAPTPGSKEEVTMAWRSEDAKPVDIPWTSMQAQESDMLGSQRSITPQNGVLHLEIGPCPVYLVAPKN